MNKSKNTKIKYCAVCSEILLFKGIKALRDQDTIDRAWHYDKYPPSINQMMKFVNKKNIRWYIQNHIKMEDKIWNNDFIHAIKKYGNIDLKERNGYPTFYWICNKNIYKALKECPFYYDGCYLKGKVGPYAFTNSACLLLKGNEESYSFIAGILLSGKKKKVKGLDYISYRSSYRGYIDRWGIPVEFESGKGRNFYISSFWPSLFLEYMPESLNDAFKVTKNIKDSLYACVLWRMYNSCNNVKTGAYPYLKSRRWMFYHLGNVDDNYKLWLDLKLTQLDKKIIERINSFYK